MKITKILNNNAVISENRGHEEIIALDKGITYGKKVGDEFDKRKIHRIFMPPFDSRRELLLGAIHETDPILFQVSQKIVDGLEHEENIELANGVYITLTGHLTTSVRKAKKGLHLGNKFIWEVKNYYPKEYRYGSWILKLLDAQLNLNFPEDETGPIVIYITSGELGNNISDFSKSVDLIKSVTRIVRYYLRIDIDCQSSNHDHFVIHLKFSWKAMMYKRDQSSFGDSSRGISNVIKNSDIEAYKCTLKIKEYILEEYNYELNNEEIMHLAIHISKIVHGKER